MIKDKRTSEVLQEIIQRFSQENEVRISDFLQMLGERAFGLAILVFSLPNSLPIPGIPGVSTLTGVPIIVLAFQLLRDDSTIQLPQKMAAKTFRAATLTLVLKKAMPFVIWLEKFLRPRAQGAVSGWGERVCALLILANALILSLPIPGGNFLPGISITILAFALLERDGKLAMIGWVGAIAALVVMIGVVGVVATTAWNYAISLL